jgi:signal transduction histidine kinase
LAGNMSRVQDYLGQLGETAQQALKEMRLLLYELRPMVLEQEGLVGALRRRLDAVDRRAGVASSLEVIDPFQVPQALEEGLYRICQEALNNTLKHANATIVVVRLSLHDDLVDVEIADNGVGFAPAEQSGGGMGMANMRERAQRMGGKMVVTSQERRGTSLHVLVPVAK